MTETIEISKFLLKKVQDWNFSEGKSFQSRFEALKQLIDEILRQKTIENDVFKAKRKLTIDLQMKNGWNAKFQNRIVSYPLLARRNFRSDRLQYEQTKIESVKIWS